MEKLKKKSENMKLLVVAGLLMITPLLSTSLRFKYLYFIVNILIIAVGAEAGLLSFFLQPEQTRKPASLHVPQKPPIIILDNDDDDDGDDDAVDKPEKIAAAVKVEESASEPSIFFIGEGDKLMEDNIEDHELYEKSETFIGNFYKQLKMQRDESSNKFHHLSAAQLIGIHKSRH